MSSPSSVRVPSDLITLPWHAEPRGLIEAGSPPLILLTGEPGTGKTTFAHHMAMTFTGQPAVVMSGSPEVEQGHIFGRMSLVGGETRFIDGPLPQALKTGRYLIIEEFSLIPIEVRSDLLPLRDQSQITNPLTGEVLPVPKEFRLIATSNSETLSCRKNAGVARVLFDGFWIYEVPDLDDIQVGRFLKHHYPNASKKRVARVLELWNEYRSLKQGETEGKNSLSYRAAAQLMTLLERRMPETTAIRVALVNKFLATDPDLFSVAKTRLLVSSPSESGTEEGPDDMRSRTEA